MPRYLVDTPELPKSPLTCVLAESKPLHVSPRLKLPSHCGGDGCPKGGGAKDSAMLVLVGPEDNHGTGSGCVSAVR